MSQIEGIRGNKGAGRREREREGEREIELGREGEKKHHSAQICIQLAFGAATFSPVLKSRRGKSGNIVDFGGVLLVSRVEL